VTQPGRFAFKRTALQGLYGFPESGQQEVNVLNPKSDLTNDNYKDPVQTDLPAPPGPINIGNDGKEFHNIGIQLFSSEKPVDTLFIYVNKDVTSPPSGDTNLTKIENWRVFKSDSNEHLWAEITADIKEVEPIVDVLNNKFSYKIIFSNPQNARFFKVINKVKASINNVLVTEIEAYGTEEVSKTGKLTEVTTFFSQGVNLNANMRATDRLSFSLNYFINRADQNPESIVASIGGIFANILTKSTTDKEERFRSNVTRTYGASSTWMAHRLLTTTLRLQRNEAFDNKDETDISSNTYSLVFSSSPLPTLDTNLSVIRSESYSFGEKQSINNLYLLSIGSRLYRNVNMITDIGYTQSRSYTTDTKSSTRSITGALDAPLTRKLYGSLTYGFSWRSSDDSSSSSKDGSVILTYRPGRFINLSGSLRISAADGSRTTSEGFLVDWLPLPAIRLNLNYQHSTSVDSLSGYGIWYITKFIDLRLTYSYTRDTNENKSETYKKLETYTYGGNLTCRFW